MTRQRDEESARKFFNQVFALIVAMFLVLATMLVILYIRRSG